MIYTGIGARKTPGDILHAMVQVGEYMAKAGHILRSGGAQGADRAFEIGCDYKSVGRKEIYLPWQHFEKHSSDLFHISQKAMDVVALFHPAWDRLSNGAKLMMARNSHQILGIDLKTPSDFVVCWTPGGKVVGGTGQALRLAAHYEIPIINFGDISLDQANYLLMKILGEVE